MGTGTGAGTGGDADDGVAASADGPRSAGAGGESESPPEEPDIEDLLEELEDLEESVDSPEEVEQVREAMRVARRVRKGVFGRVIHGYDLGDVAESVLGALLFGIPMAVEGGTTEVGAFFVTHPPLLVATGAFAVLSTAGIIYVADFQDVRVRRQILGVVPRRLAGIVSISFLTAVGLLTAWGRVDWGEPLLALATVVVAFLPMSIGAALGDILPGS